MSSRPSRARLLGPPRRLPMSPSPSSGARDFNRLVPTRLRTRTTRHHRHRVQCCRPGFGARPTGEILATDTELKVWPGFEPGLAARLHARSTLLDDFECLAMHQLDAVDTGHVTRRSSRCGPMRFGGARCLQTEPTLARASYAMLSGQPTRTPERSRQTAWPPPAPVDDAVERPVRCRMNARRFIGGGHPAVPGPPPHFAGLRALVAVPHTT